MDSLRGQNEIEASAPYEDEAIEAPPVIAGSERRMQVRAYNYWVSLLGNRGFPSIEDLNPEEMEDFGAFSVLLDFSLGLENPAIIYLGSALRDECGITGTIERIDQVPPRSLLSRLTDHYLQIIANAAPVGFEAEFTNQRGVEIMYRGILMPFSSNDETIDFIYGVINWKEVASQTMVDGLGEEIRAALASPDAARQGDGAIWAEGPSATADFDLSEPMDAEVLAVEARQEEGAELDLAAFEREEPLDLVDVAPEPARDEPLVDVADWEAAVEHDPIGIEDIDPVLDAEMDAAPPMPAEAAEEGLSARLILARQSAAEAGENDARSRVALYRAIGNAYDFALEARAAPEDYDALLKEAGIAVQARSPNTAVIKLVFGADHDKTRIAEYACALDYAFARGLAGGELPGQLLSHEGGLKGLVRDMRAERRAESAAGKTDRPVRRIDRAVRRLSDAHAVDAAALPFDEHGLAVVVARREADGGIALVAGVDMADKAAQKILIEASKGL